MRDLAYRAATRNYAVPSLNPAKLAAMGRVARGSSVRDDLAGAGRRHDPHAARQAPEARANLLPHASRDPLRRAAVGHRAARHKAIAAIERDGNGSSSAATDHTDRLGHGLPDYRIFS